MYQTTVDNIIVSKYKDHPVYSDLLHDFVSGLPNRLHDMQAYIDEHDWDALGKQMHQLRGAAATYGFPLLSETAAQIEETVPLIRSDESTGDQLAAYADNLRDVCRRIEAGAVTLTTEI